VSANSKAKLMAALLS